MGDKMSEKEKKAPASPEEKGVYLFMEEVSQETCKELISFHRLSKSLKELSKVFLALLSFVRGLFTILIPKKKEALIQKKWVRKDEIPSEKGALSVNLEEQDSSKVKIESSLKEKTPASPKFPTCLFL